MRVLKFQLVIKSDDFNRYSLPQQEVTDEQLGRHYDYVVRRIKDDKNFWTQEIIRTERLVETKAAQ
jgi:hypothetical protein